MWGTVCKLNPAIKRLKTEEKEYIFNWFKAQFRHREREMVDFISHDMKCKNEEQRKEVVRSYLREYFSE